VALSLWHVESYVVAVRGGALGGSETPLPPFQFFIDGAINRHL